MRYRRRRVLLTLSALAASAAVVLTAGVVPAQAATLPLECEAIAFLNSTLFWNYSASPPGANRGVTPSAAHPYPVVLVEGTFASMYNSFGAISPDLVNNGYCVYAFNYGQTLPLTGFYAMGDIADIGQRAGHRGQPGAGRDRAPARSTWSAGRRAA